MSDKKKVYGLIIPKKPGQDKKKSSGSAPVFNVFGDDQDSDEDEKTKGPVGPYGFTKTNSKLKLQNQMDIEKAMMDDPSVYEYDNIYDDIQASKAQIGKQEETKSKKSSKPQYITGLLKAAEEKKKEQERRNERKVQKEREAEGEKYADKEAFVTSAYKQKMLERQKEEEEERRKEQIEEMTDVTKQKDLGGFYRYLYRQSTGTEKETKDNLKIKEEPPEEVEPKKESETSSRRRRSSLSSSSASDKSDSYVKLEKKSPIRKNREKPTVTQRQFRKKRHDSSSDDDNKSCEERNQSLRDENDERSSKRSKKSPSYQDAHKNVERKQRSPSPDYKARKESKRDRRSSSPKSSSRQNSPSNQKIGSSRSRSPLQNREEPSSSSNERLNFKSRRHSEEKDEGRHNTGSSDGRVKKLDHSQSEKDKTNKVARHDEGISGDENDQEEAASQPKRNIEGPMANANSKVKAAPIDPKDKVYPHHNSAKDIAEARKRYLIRKLEREKARGS